MNSNNGNSVCHPERVEPNRAKRSRNEVETRLPSAANAAPTNVGEPQAEPSLTSECNPTNRVRREAGRKPSPTRRSSEVSGATDTRCRERQRSQSFHSDGQDRRMNSQRP